MSSDLQLLKNVGFILGGHDQSGKTTLAQHLCKITGHSYVHNGPPEEGVTFVYEYTKDIKNHKVVIDRSYICEKVYGSVVRNQNNITPEIQQSIEDFFREKNYIFILCFRTQFNMDNFIERDELFDFHTIQKVKQRYLEEYKTITLPKIMIDPFENPLFLLDIVKLIKGV